jgi:hypothetical protein
MAANTAYDAIPSTGQELVPDSAIDRVLAIPEPDALKLYSLLSSTQQWRARTRATGRRRIALTQYHVLAFAQLR